MKLILCFLAACISLNLRAEPPYLGTAFVAPNIITESDPSTLVSISYQGTGIRNMFDRRTAMFQDYSVYLFDVIYSDSTPVEIQVNTEFNQLEAEEKATFYATSIGRIPAALKKDVAFVWMHKGDEVFGGGNSSILIHTGFIAEGYIFDGVLEEILVHESTHTSIDADHALAPLWQTAQQDDDAYISIYARDSPAFEDMAESLLMYLAVVYRSERISTDMKETIETTIPNRISYIAAQNFDFSLLEIAAELIFESGFE